MKISIFKNRQSGFVLAVAMIGILAMTFFMMTSFSTATSTVKVAGNYSKTVNVFNLAEMGIAKARPMIENQSFDTVLTNYSSTYLIAPTTFMDGTYEVTVADDARDSDGNPLTDNNNIIQVVSTGRNSQGGKVTIKTHLQLIDATNPITFPPNGTCGSASCDSAVVFCGGDADLQLQGTTAKIDGADYPIPAYGCSGSDCTTTPDSGTTSNPDIISDGSTDVTLTGGATSPTSIDNLGSDSSCDNWQTFWNQWASVSSSAPGVVLIGGSTDTYTTSNDCTDPKIFLINTTAPTLSISGTTYMCGMFIIASNTSIDLSGTVTLVGAILAMGNSSSLSYSGTSGTSNFYGKLIYRSNTVDSDNELFVKGNASVNFSSAGLDYALQAINNANAGGGASGSGTLITSAWEESY